MVRISFITCAFLIGLRLVIGWHFFFEGVAKYESTKLEGTEGAKSFTSKGYFAEVEGPAAKYVRQWIGDDNLLAYEKVRLNISPDIELTDDPNEYVNRIRAALKAKDKPAELMPVALAKEWDDYLQAFCAAYKIEGKERELAEKRVEQAKSDYVLWLADSIKDDSKKSIPDDPRTEWITVTTLSRPALIYKPEDPAPKRVRVYRIMLNEIRDGIEREMVTFGRPVESDRYRALKTKTAQVRAKLVDDVAARTKKMKALLANQVEGNLAGYDIGPTEDLFVDDRLLKLIDVKDGKMPAALENQWDGYYAWAKQFGGNPQDGERNLADAKLRYVRYMSDLDPFDGKQRPDQDVTARLRAYKSAVDQMEAARNKFIEEPTLANFVAVGKLNPETARLRQTFIEDVRNQTDYLKKSLGSFPEVKEKSTDDPLKGTVEVVKPKPKLLGIEMPASTNLEWFDWSIRWGLLIGGGCLLLGLFTRLACFGCIVFLVMETLSNPSLPWLPVSPKVEGSYYYVNKNAVELLALLVLMTLPTGRWLGLDAWLSRIWPFRSRRDDV